MENSVNRLFDLFQGLNESASWKAAFGEPQTQGDTTIIPVAAVSYGLGMGMGTSGTEEGEDEGDQGAGGAGGGGGSTSRPVAIIEITPEKTVIRPIIDYGKLAVAGMLTAAWVVFLWTRVLNKFIRLREEGRA